MNPKLLTRDSSKVHACLKELEDGTLVALKECKIYIPARFVERQLAFLGTESVISGIFAITVGDAFYGVSLAVAMMRIEPSSTNYIKVLDEDYVEFIFEAGSVVISNLNLVKNDMLVYRVYTEIIASGHVPWFLSYEDMGRIFESTSKHAGVTVGANHAIVEMIVSSISRNPNDLTKFFRHELNTAAELKSKVPEFIPLRSVTYGASNTTAKLVGAYWDEGLTSALVNPADTVEPIEGLLRR